MKPLFLPDVENQPQPGATADLINVAKNAGTDYPQIWHLFAYKSQATQHLGAFTQEIMRGAGPFGPGLRELIAAFTSYGNDCDF